MILEIFVAVQIFAFIIIATHHLNKKKKENDIKRKAEIRRLNYMADADSASSMEEGFDIDFDRQQKVWSRHISKILA
jgi:hypothetical protein